MQTSGTAFQRQVWAALRGIPAGATTSYGRLAAQIGRPESQPRGRAGERRQPGVGSSCPATGWVGANASLTGYGGGLERKAWLLAHERRAAQPDLLGHHAPI